jgi:chemotaxis protein MotB
MQGVGKGMKRADEKDFKAVKAQIDAALVKQNLQDKVVVSVNQRGLIISLKEAGFFDSGSALIKLSSYPTLTLVAKSLVQYNNSIRVEGHTDNIPIKGGSFHSNWELSTARATNVVHHLINYYRFSPERISATGYGEFRPAEDNSTEEGRSKNRRVNIVMLSKDGEKGEP